MNCTEGFRVLYITNDDFKLVGYTDSYWAGSLDDRKEKKRKTNQSKSWQTL